jgi:hypothetical protein
MVNTKPNEYVVLGLSSSIESLCVLRSHEIFERIKTNLLIEENKIKERSIQVRCIYIS